MRIAGRRFFIGDDAAMNEESLDNLSLPPVVGAGGYRDAGAAVRAMEQNNTEGAIWYDQTWRAIKAANPDWSDQQVTDVLTLQIQIADWNAQYQNIIKDIAHSNSVEEREQKIVFHATKLDAFRASGIPVDNDLQYLRNVQGDIRHALNQELNTSRDVKRTDEAVKFSQELREQVEYNYNIKMGISPAVIDYEPGEIPDDLANQYEREREEGMASAVGEAVKGMWAYLNKPLFDSATRLTAADLEAGYWEGVLADGLTRVRVRYDEDGSLALHPEDQKLYEETMGNYSKGIIASGLIQGAVPFLSPGAKNMLARLGKMNTQGSSKAAEVAGKTFRTAKEGGKHGNFYNQYTTKKTEEIQKGIRSIEKQIAEHEDKIANPQKYIENFSKLDPRQQEALINRKWPSDIERQKEQLDILKGILGERGL